MFSLTNFIILMSWLLAYGSLWLMSIDLSDKNLDKAGVSEKFRESAKAVRKRFSHLTWVTIIIFNIFFFISIVFLGKSIIEFVVIGLIAFGLFLIPPIRNLSTNAAAMIIQVIYLQFDDELTKEKIRMNKFRNELKEQMNSKAYIIELLKNGGTSQDKIDKLSNTNFKPTPPDDELLNHMVASRMSSEAFKCLNGEKYAEAKIKLEAVFWLKNDFAPAWNYYGITLLTEGEIEAAIAAFNNAKKYKPLVSPPYFMLALAYLFLGDYGEARKIRTAGRFVLNAGDAKKLLDETKEFDKYGLFEDLHPGQSTEQFFNEYKNLVLDDEEFEELIRNAKNIKWDSENIKKYAQEFVNFDIVNTQKYQRIQTAQLGMEFLSSQRL